MKESYIDKSLTTLNNLHDSGELYYKKPVSKEQAVETLRKYASEFPFRYVNEEVGYVHGNNGLADLCAACQLDYPNAMMNSRSVKYHIDENEGIDSVQAAVREIILKECDAVMATDNHYEMFLHACILYAVLDAYRNYVNSGIKGVRDGKVSGLLKYGMALPLRLDRKEAGL